MSNLKEMLVVTDEDEAMARKHYQKSESDIKQDVTILKEWLRQQPHLPEDDDEGRLERMFLKNKCRLEQTKKKLDKCYSFKLIYSDMLDMYNIHSARIQNARKSMLLVPLSKLNDKQERIFCFKVTNAEIFRGIETVLYALMMMELCNTYDYSVADLYIVDWEGFSFNAMMTVEPSVIHKFATIAMESLSGRFSSIQFINVPSFIDIFLQLAKAVMKPKLFKKIKCHATVEGIYSLIPRETLPMEYGGEEKSIYKLHEEWGQELTFHEDLLTEICKRTSNEKLRTKKLVESELFGMDGSFKKINLD